MAIDHATDGKGSVPAPDPTSLTTDMSDRLREEMQRELTSLGDRITDRFIAMESTIIKLEDRLNEHWDLITKELEESVTERKYALEHAAQTIDAALSASTKLNEEKFKSIQTQFSERDVRTEQAATGTKLAVDAALQAQKEAAGTQNESNNASIAKSEALFVKQLDGQSTLFDKRIDGLSALVVSQVAGLNDKIADLKGRQDRGEGTDNGVNVSHISRQSDSNNMALSIAAIVAIASLVLAFVMAFIHH